MRNRDVPNAPLTLFLGSGIQFLEDTHVQTAVFVYVQDPPSYKVGTSTV